MTPRRTRIKIGGITSDEAAWCAVEAGADALGFVFIPSSPNNIEPEAAWDIASALPPFITTVGVFANPAVEDIDEARESFPFDLVQLMGAEPEPLVRDAGPDVIKAIRFDPATIEAELRKWSRIAEIAALLIDAPASARDAPFHWNALAPHADASDHPLIISGGLNAQNVAEAVRAVRPYAVEVSTGVESAPGVKDARKIADFCAAVRRADLE